MWPSKDSVKLTRSRFQIFQRSKKPCTQLEIWDPLPQILTQLGVEECCTTLQFPWSKRKQPSTTQAFCHRSALAWKVLQARGRGGRNLQGRWWTKFFYGHGVGFCCLNAWSTVTYCLCHKPLAFCSVGRVDYLGRLFQQHPLCCEVKAHHRRKKTANCKGAKGGELAETWTSATLTCLHQLIPLTSSLENCFVSWFFTNDLTSSFLKVMSTERLGEMVWRQHWSGPRKPVRDLDHPPFVGSLCLRFVT